MATNKTPRKHPNGEMVITVLRKDYVKIGKSQKRFALYRDGMTVQQYVDACAKLGDDKGAADIRWDSSGERRGGPLIKLSAPKQAATTTKAA